MIDDNKINIVQEKIKKAIAQIEKEEDVKISFGSIRYNSAYYTSQIKVSSLVKSDKVKSVYESICKRFGFTQDIIGMEFISNLKNHKIVDINTRGRKYPIITQTVDGKRYKFTVSDVKRLIGGDKIVNRNANLDKLI